MNTYGEGIFGNQVPAIDPAVPAVPILPSLVSSLDTPKPVVVAGPASPLPSSLVVAGAPIRVGGRRSETQEYGRGIFGGRVPLGTYAYADHKTLYIGLAVAAVALGGFAWWKMKKPASATPNRRRRHYRRAR